MKRALYWTLLALFDLAALALCGWLRLPAWARGGPDRPIYGLTEADARFWPYGSASDLVLNGPDAGNWAKNAQNFLEGSPLDIYRMPTYTFLVGWMGRRFEDLAFSGHLVNHLAGVALAPVVYLFGKGPAGRGAALGAAVLTAVAPILVNTQKLYGVDPTLQLALLTLFAAAWWVSRGPWWLAPLAGVAAGIAASTHYLGLLFPVPLLLLVALGQRRWGRLLAPLLMGLSAYLTFRWMFHLYPPLGLSQIASTYAEGVAASQGEVGVSQSTLGSAVVFVRERLPAASLMVVQRALGTASKTGAPWAALVPLFWVGLLAPMSLRPGANLVVPRSPRDALRFVAAWNWLPNLWFLTLLAPIALMLAARAPDRYGLYAEPLYLLVLFRGLAALCALPDAGLARLWGRWPKGLLAIALCAGLAYRGLAPLQSAWPGLMPIGEGLQDRAAGALVRENFPQSAGRHDAIVTLSQNLPFYADRQRCPNQPCAEGVENVPRCASQILQQCRGSGDLPYVVETKAQHGFADRPSEAMDQAVAARFEKVGAVGDSLRTLTIYRVPRSELVTIAASSELE